MAEEKNRSIAIRKDRQIKQYALQSPQQLKAMAIVLKDHIKKNELSANIAGRDYVMVEGWQFAGGLLGTMPRITEIKDLTHDQEVKWMAKAEIIEIKSGKTVSIGFAVCSNKEAKKRGFDEYAVLSMAQTRAIGKAYRNVIGWVIKMAGYEATPSEEMMNAGPGAGKPAPDATYNKALMMIAKARTPEELEQFKASLEKGRGAKLYSKEQREQLIRLIERRMEGNE